MSFPKRRDRRNPFSRLAAMPGRAPIRALACALAISLTGCGSDGGGTIPESDATQMLGLLSVAESDLQSGNCDLLTSRANKFASMVEALPSSVDDSVRSELDEAAQNLTDLADEPDQCQGATGATGAQGTETTEPTTEAPTTPEPSTTDEAPPTDKPDHPSGGRGVGAGGGAPADQGAGNEQPPTETTIEPPTGDGGDQGTVPGAGQGGGSTGQNQGADSGGITQG